MIAGSAAHERFTSTGVLRPIAVAPPRAYLRNRESVVRYTRTAPVASGSSIALTFRIRTTAASESASILRPAARADRIEAPHALHKDVLDHRRFQMGPRQVIVFPPLVSLRRMDPRPFTGESEE